MCSVILDPLGEKQASGERLERARLCSRLASNALIPSVENHPTTMLNAVLYIYIVLLITEGSLVYMTPREKLGPSDEI